MLDCPGGTQLIQHIIVQDQDGQKQQHKEILLISDSAKKIKTLVFSILTDMLKTVPVEDFQHCYQKWEQCIHWCLAAHENYFEGDNIDV